jgi:Ca2+-binding RTX toxin-like protein
MCIVCGLLGANLLGDGATLPREPYFARLLDESGVLAMALDGRGAPVANGAPLMPVAALVAGDAFFRWGADDAPVGTPMVVTYSFMSAVPSYDAVGTRPNFLAFDAAQRDSTRAALEAWASVSGLAFIEVASGFGQIRFGMHDFAGTQWSTSAGYAYYADDVALADGSLSGDVWLRRESYGSDALTSAWGRHLLLHEIGHAIGLKHPFDDTPNLSAAEDDIAYTVMSYDGAATGRLGPYDVDAARYLYGFADIAWFWDAATYTLTRLGGAGAEAIVGIEFPDIARAGGGNDLVTGGFGVDTLYGDGGDDRIEGGNDADFLFGDGDGNDGNDVIEGGVGGDVVYAGGGADVVYGGLASGFAENDGDVVFAGDGADTVAGAGGRDIVYGEGGADVLHGGYFENYSGSGDDVLFGGASNDQLFGGDGADWLIGGGFDGTPSGDDVADGGAGDDWITGEDGGDQLLGGFGRDLLFGNAGNDYLDGGGDDDALYPGAGNDLIRTGFGRDLILIAANERDAGGYDYVADLARGVDFIGLGGVAPSTIVYGAYAGGAYGLVPVAGGTWTLLVANVTAAQLQASVFAWTG